MLLYEYKTAFSNHLVSRHFSEREGIARRMGRPRSSVSRAPFSQLFIPVKSKRWMRTLSSTSIAKRPLFSSVALCVKPKRYPLVIT